MKDNEIIESKSLLAAQKEALEAKSGNKTETKKVAPVKKKKASKTARTISQILNGDFLNKEFVLNNLNFIFFVFFLLLILVAKGYYGKELIKNVEKERQALEELNGDYVAAKAKLEEETRRIKLVEKLEPKGLKETVNPTKVIRLKTE